MKFKDTIKRLRFSTTGETRYTQVQVAKLLGVSVNTVARWERGEKEPNNKMVYEKLIDSLVSDLSVKL